MRTGNIFTVALVALAALVVGCETMQLKRVEPRVAPESFSTYAWGQSALSDVPEASAQLVELDEELRTQVEGLMQARGYRLLDDKARADMVMDYQVAVVEEQFAGDPTDSSWDAQFENNVQANVVELPVRTGAPRVTVTLGLGRAGAPAIWGGSASELLTRPENGDERRRILSGAVNQLLRDLPPAS
jgi:hypothetical protein